MCKYSLTNFYISLIFRLIQVRLSLELDHTLATTTVVVADNRM